jgi:hypothetical protein
LETVDERALNLALPGDVVCTRRPYCPDFLEYLNSLGIGPDADSVIVLDPDSKMDPLDPLPDILLRNKPALNRIGDLFVEAKAVNIHTYITTPNEKVLASLLESVLKCPLKLMGGDPAAVLHFNRKDIVRDLALRLGVPIPDGEVVIIERGANGTPRTLEPIRKAVFRNIAATGRAMVRGVCGATGSATFPIYNPNESLEQQLKKISERVGNEKYIVESMLKIDCSPNIVTHIDPWTGEIACVAVSDQVLNDEYTYTGNLFPSSSTLIEEMTDTAMRLAECMRNKGFTGPAGFDFCQYTPPGSNAPTLFLAEINPRINGVMYTMGLRDNLNEIRRRQGIELLCAGMLTKFRTRYRTFNDLRSAMGSLMMTRTSKEGIFPYAIGQLQYNQCHLAIFAESVERAKEIHENFCAANPYSQ